MRINFFQLTSRQQTSRQDKVKSSPLPLKQGKSPEGGMGYDVSLSFRMVIPALSRELECELEMFLDPAPRGKLRVIYCLTNQL